MDVAVKTGALGLRVSSLLLLFCCLACHCSPYLNKGIVHSVDRVDVKEKGAVPGRIVSVPVKVYRDAFKDDTLKLGQCPLVMKEGSIKACKDEFEGEEVYLAKGATTVDATRVQSSEDILLHGMGGIGVSVGVLGLASVSAKVKVAVTTQTNRNSLNLMSSYAMSTGVITLHNPRPKHLEGGRDGDGGVLFLSELELGGDEMLLVTLEFESEEQKVEVEVSVTVKILFISITAKLNYIHENFKSRASCRVQFKSSWRKEKDEYFTDLVNCIPVVQKIEDTYMEGPKKLKAMGPEDKECHYYYHFSSWRESPYGMQFNLALINHDLEFLTEQNTEIKAVIDRINKLKHQLERWPSEVKRKVLQLNETVTDITKQLTEGLEKYHTLKPLKRQQLGDIYGLNKAPLYYTRRLEKLTAEANL